LPWGTLQVWEGGGGVDGFLPIILSSPSQLMKMSSWAVTMWTHVQICSGARLASQQSNLNLYSCLLKYNLHVNSFVLLLSLWYFKFSLFVSFMLKSVSILTKLCQVEAEKVKEQICHNLKPYITMLRLQEYRLVWSFLAFIMQAKLQS
jgi:hypothetical protein